MFEWCNILFHMMNIQFTLEMHMLKRIIPLE